MKKTVSYLVALGYLLASTKALALESNAIYRNEIASLIQNSSGDTPILEIVKRFKQKRTQLKIPWTNDFQTNLQQLRKFGVISQDELKEALALQPALDRVVLNENTKASAAYYQVIANEQYASAEILIPLVTFIILALIADYTSKKIGEDEITLCPEEGHPTARSCEPTSYK